MPPGHLTRLRDWLRAAQTHWAWPQERRERQVRRSRLDLPEQFLGQFLDRGPRTEQPRAKRWP
jgi:hypothetical protein